MQNWVMSNMESCTNGRTSGRVPSYKYTHMRTFTWARLPIETHTPTHRHLCLLVEILLRLTICLRCAHKIAARQDTELLGDFP